MSLAHDGDFLDVSSGLLHFICSETMLMGVSCSNSTAPVYFISLMYNRDIVQNKWRDGNHGFVGYPFDYRVTLGFGSIAGGLDHVNPVDYHLSMGLEGDDQDQDPPEDSQIKRKRKDADTSSLKKGKTQSKSSKSSKAPTKPSQTKKVMDEDEQIQDGAVDDIEIAHDADTTADEMPQADTAPSQDRSKCWFNDMENAKKSLVTFDDVIGSVVDFTKFVKNCLQKEKIRKADFKERAFKLLKGNYKNYIELEYNFEQCYLPLIDQTDWINLERERVSYDLSKPLVLQGPPGRTTIHVDFFFNKDLEYLKKRSTERRYASPLTKLKVAWYEIEGLEDMIPNLWIDSKEKYDINAAIGIYHWGLKHQLFYKARHNQFSYGYLKEIVVRRANQMEYIFNEAGFKRLHLNDIEYMYLLYAQNKLHHLKGHEQIDLVMAL
ncbi:hypothetical protein Tco_1345547 [Tanacetum coccineum]